MSSDWLRVICHALQEGMIWKGWFLVAKVGGHGCVLLLGGCRGTALFFGRTELEMHVGNLHRFGGWCWRSRTRIGCWRRLEEFSAGLGAVVQAPVTADPRSFLR